MVWGKIKRKVASRNMDFKLSSVEELTRTEIAKVSLYNFMRYVSHAIIEEERLQTTEHFRYIIKQLFNKHQHSIPFKKLGPLSKRRNFVTGTIRYF